MDTRQHEPLHFSPTENEVNVIKAILADLQSLKGKSYSPTDSPDVLLLVTSPLNTKKKDCSLFAFNITEENLLGQGSYGTVYRGYAVDPQTNKRDANKQVVVKICQTEKYHPEEGYSALFYPVWQPIVNGVDTYLISDLLPGEALLPESETLQRMSLHTRLKLAKSIADNFHWLARESIYHRDIKGDNILFTKHGESSIVDFGLAKKADDINSIEMRTDRCGTPQYTAPEVRQEGPVRGVTTDAYSLASIFLIIFGAKNVYKDKVSAEEKSNADFDAAHQEKLLAAEAESQRAMQQYEQAQLTYTEAKRAEREAKQHNWAAQRHHLSHEEPCLTTNKIFLQEREHLRLAKRIRDEAKSTHQALKNSEDQLRKLPQEKSYKDEKRRRRNSAISQTDYNFEGIFEGYAIPENFRAYATPLMTLFFNRLQHQDYALRPDPDEIVAFFHALYLLGEFSLKRTEENLMVNEINACLSKMKLLANTLWYAPVKDYIATSAPLSFCQFEFDSHPDICRWLVEEPNLTHLAEPVRLPIDDKAEPPATAVSQQSSAELIEEQFTKQKKKIVVDGETTLIAFPSLDPDCKDSVSIFGFDHRTPLDAERSIYQAYLVNKKTGQWLEKPYAIQILPRGKKTERCTTSSYAFFQSPFPIVSSWWEGKSYQLLTLAKIMAPAGTDAPRYSEPRP